MPDNKLQCVATWATRYRSQLLLTEQLLGGGSGPSFSLILPFGGAVWVFGGDSLFRFVEVVLSSHSSLRRWGLGFWWRFPLRVCGGGSFFILPFGGGVWVFGGDSLFRFVEVVLSSHSSIWWWGLGFWWRFPLRVCGGGSFFLFFHSAVGSGFLVAIPSSGLWRWFFFLFFHSAVGSGFLVAIPSSGLWRWFSFLILPFGGGVWVFGGDSLFRFVEVVLFFILPFGGGVWVFGGDSLFGFVEVVLSSHSSIRRRGLGFWWRFPLQVCGGGSLFSFFHSAVGSGFLVAIPSSGLWRWFFFYSSIRRWGLGFWWRFPLQVCGGGSLFSFFHLAVGLKCFYVLF